MRCWTLLLVSGLASFLILHSLSKNAAAGVFSPSTTKECLNKYIPRTKSDTAANIVYQACDDLFTSSIEDIRKKFPKQKTLSDEELLDFIYKKYYKDISEKDFKEKIKKKDLQRKQEAQCILDLDELYEAQNNAAADIIYSNSECLTSQN